MKFDVRDNFKVLITCTSVIRIAPFLSIFYFLDMGEDRGGGWGRDNCERCFSGVVGVIKQSLLKQLKEEVFWGGVGVGCV